MHKYSIQRVIGIGKLPRSKEGEWECGNLEIVCASGGRLRRG